MNSYSRVIHNENCIRFLNFFNVRCVKAWQERGQPEMELPVDYEGLEILAFV
jgi:hypothetical protein